MFAVITRQPGRPTKAQVLAALRELDLALQNRQQVVGEAKK
jgi:hypothetical protein